MMFGRRAKCVVCGSNELIDFQRVDAGELKVCGECRHISWGRMPAGKELEEYYRTTYTGAHDQEALQDSARPYYRDHLADLLRRSGRKASETTLVDYGSSYPTLLEEAKSAGFGRPIGVEPDEGARARAATLGIEMHAPDVFAGKIKNGSVHIARFSHVLEHLPDPVAALSVVAEKLAAGGLVHITQPSFPVLAAEACDVPLRDCVWPEHLHFFNMLSLRVLVERVGLRVCTAFTHQRAGEAVVEFGGRMDLAHAATRLSEVRDMGEGQWGRLANYPAYAGENSALYAVKPG